MPVHPGQKALQPAPSSAVLSPDPPFAGSCSGLVEAELRCPQLAALSLKGCGSLRRLALDCPSLGALDATFCGDLDDAGASPSAWGAVLSSE